MTNYGLIRLVVEIASKIDEKGNARAKENKNVVPKRFFIMMWIIGFFIFVAGGIVLLSTRELIELSTTEWLTITLFIWLGGVVCLLMFVINYRVLIVKYNEEFILVTNLFYRTKKITYDEIIRITDRDRIVTKNKKYAISGAYFYGTKALKEIINQKIIERYELNKKENESE